MRINLIDKLTKHWYDKGKFKILIRYTKKNCFEKGSNMLNIENFFVENITLGENFDYKALYNDSRGACYKEEYKSLIRGAIRNKAITVEKFLIAENVQEQLYKIGETKGHEYTLIKNLKDYHNEPDYIVAPLVYLLKELDPQFKINTNDGKPEIESNIFDLEIRPRIDGQNATPRMFFSEENVVITLMNDNVENLGDILAVKDVKVYVLGTDNFSNTIYAYKIKREDRFFEMTKGFKDHVTDELF